MFHICYMEHKQNEFLHYFPPNVGDLEVFLLEFIPYLSYTFVTILHTDCKEDIKERREV